MSSTECKEVSSWVESSQERTFVNVLQVLDFAGESVGSLRVWASGSRRLQEAGVSLFVRCMLGGPSPLPRLSSSLFDY